MAAHSSILAKVPIAFFSVAKPSVRYSLRQWMAVSKKKVQRD